MNAAGWVRCLLDRPIEETERRGAIAATALVLIAATALLAITSAGVPATQQAPDPHRAPRAVRIASRAHLPANALRTARRFLNGYLAFVYGRAPVSAVKETTSSFAAALRRHLRTVPPALLSLHPRVIALGSTSSSGSAIVVTALVKDSEVLAYPIRVVLADRGGRYLVIGLGRS